MTSQARRGLTVALVGCFALLGAATSQPQADGTGTPPAPPAVPAVPAAPIPAQPVAQPVAQPAAPAGRYGDALDELNELCGDTWCEGEYDYRFTALVCDPAPCRLTFTATYYEEGSTPVEQTVELTGITDPVDSEGSSTEAFWDAVSAAIDRFESSHRH